MLSKFRPKLVVILIFILFLVIKYYGSAVSTSYGGIEEVQEENDENAGSTLKTYNFLIYSNYFFPLQV